uniref:Methyltransferase domain-containing protein n=1 Tax=Candidatus Kentrum sp. FM TaxID=2126340 RepID=A0A450TDG5_9GAMM|nr:MAG: Methyltransferase domain-containing protein [Candidatus Kentron sp. FM]VFJ65675.1 MAG: Methyltransferase domain-containing protein [Candidatus Kentron sp. FM]VFK16477.1 MAG: Methyltransferase domain-containing protein [Candidatus Kentron sp. FM]
MSSLDRYDSMVFAYQYEYMKGRISLDGDIEYYLERLRGVTEDVLELGCGTGRIALELAGNGARVLGVDSAAAMLEIAKEKLEKKPWKDRVNFQLSDIIRFHSNRRYGRIIIPGNTICFIGNDSLEDFIGNLGELLNDEGRVYFDFTRPVNGRYKKVEDPPWSAPLYLSEVDKTVRWKMPVYPNEISREVIYEYQWEVTDKDNAVRFSDTSFRFSSLSFEDYHRLFSKHGFMLIDKEERPSERDGESERHLFVEYRYRRDIG